MQLSYRTLYFNALVISVIQFVKQPAENGFFRETKDFIFKANGCVLQWTSLVRVEHRFSSSVHSNSSLYALRYHISALAVFKTPGVTMRYMFSSISKLSGN